MRRRGLYGAGVVAVACVALAGPRTAAAGGMPYHALDPAPKLLATTPGLEHGELAELLDRLERRGLVVPLAFVGGGFVVLDADGVEDALHAEPAVGGVWRERVPVAAGGGDRRAAGLLRFWNDGFAEPAPVARGVLPARICEGAFDAESGPAARSACDAGRHGDLGKVHFAAGRVAVSLVLPARAGSGEWPAERREKAASEVARALHWWSLRSGRQVAFVVDDLGATPSAQDPGSLPIEDEELWIADCLRGLPAPIDEPCAYAGLAELNRRAKESLRAHWACTQFVLDADAFPGSPALAYAYLGGPHTVALYDNGPWTVEELDRVVAHEFGHIFQCPDEYAGACRCTDAWGYFRTPNRNCAETSCAEQVGACVMRGAGEYSLDEMHAMEVAVHPCVWTMETAGLRDLDGDGIPDVRDTEAETIFASSLPETLETSRDVVVRGSTWDEPYPSPEGWAEDVTVNRIAGAQFSVPAGAWIDALPVDGAWTSAREDFELRLPQLGGGTHTLAVRGINSVGSEDPTPARFVFLVHDVILRGDLVLEPIVVLGPDGEPVSNGLLLEWHVDGEDFGSEYVLFRERSPEPEELVATIRSPGGPDPRFRWEDTEVRAGSEHLYRLEVRTPGKAPKELGRARGTPVLPETSGGKLVALAPNPFRDEVLFSVRVPHGSGSAGVALATVRVFDVGGRLIRDLGTVRAGETERFDVRWDGWSDLGAASPPGVYLVRVDFGGASETRKVVRLR